MDRIGSPRQVSGTNSSEFDDKLDDILSGQAVNRLYPRSVNNLAGELVSRADDMSMPQVEIDPATGRIKPSEPNQDTRGYVLDLDGNGKYDRGKDAVLAFDLDHNGDVSRKEIETSNNILSAWGGKEDFNGDGKVSKEEAAQATGYRAKYKSMDKNNDGKLDNQELVKSSARMLVDTNEDGRFSESEQRYVNNFQTGRGRFTSVNDVKEIDPKGKSVVTTESLEARNARPRVGPGSLTQATTPPAPAQKSQQAKDASHPSKPSTKSH